MLDLMFSWSVAGISTKTYDCMNPLCCLKSLNGELKETVSKVHCYSVYFTLSISTSFCFTIEASSKLPLLFFSKLGD